MTHPPRAKSMRGFTLTELMIVVAIVAILAAIGLPAYTGYARQAKRADATASLSQIMTLQERFFTDNNRYAADGTELGFADAAPASNEDFWTITFVVGPQVQLTATPRDDHRDDKCAQIILFSSGVREGKDSGGNDSQCWGGK